MNNSNRHAGLDPASHRHAELDSASLSVIAGSTRHLIVMLNLIQHLSPSLRARPAISIHYEFRRGPVNPLHF